MAGFNVDLIRVDSLELFDHSRLSQDEFNSLIMQIAVARAFQSTLAVDRLVKKAKASVKRVVRKLKSRKHARYHPIEEAKTSGTASTAVADAPAPVDDSDEISTVVEDQPDLPPLERVRPAIQDVANFWHQVRTSLQYISNDSDAPIRERLRCEFPEIQSYLRAEDAITFPLPGTEPVDVPATRQVPRVNVRAAVVHQLQVEEHAAELHGFDQIVDAGARQHLQQIVAEAAAEELENRGLPPEMLGHDFIRTWLAGVVTVQRVR